MHAVVKTLVRCFNKPLNVCCRVMDDWTGVKSVPLTYGLSPKDWIRRCFSACRYDVLPYAGLKLTDWVVSESEKDPKRVQCTVAFGEGLGKYIGSLYPSGVATDRGLAISPIQVILSQGLVATSGLVGFQFYSAGCLYYCQ